MLLYFSRQRWNWVGASTTVYCIYYVFFLVLQPLFIVFMASSFYLYVLIFECNFHRTFYAVGRSVINNNNVKEVVVSFTYCCCIATIHHGLTLSFLRVSSVVCYVYLVSFSQLATATDSIRSTQCSKCRIFLTDSLHFDEPSSSMSKGFKHRTAHLL